MGNNFYNDGDDILFVFTFVLRSLRADKGFFIALSADSKFILLTNSLQENEHK